jgi:hypothetical protein
MGKKPHQSNQWVLKGPYLRAVNSSNKSSPQQAAKALLSQELATWKIDIALIQKPWVYGEKIRGLCSKRGTKFSAGLSLTPGSCIFVRNATNAFLLSEFCSRNVMTARITYTK